MAAKKLILGLKTAFIWCVFIFKGLRNKVALLTFK